jgi:hypothetical protein
MPSSNVIRSSFSSPTTRAVQYLKEVATELEKEQKDLKALGGLSEKLKRSIKSIQTIIDKWSEHMQTLEDDAAIAAENTVFEGFAVNGYKPTELVDLLDEKMMEVDLAIAEIKVAKNGTGGGGNQATTPAAPVQYLPLPKPTLLTFDGNGRDWGSFWQNFEDNIGKNESLTDTQRLTFLIGQLRGPAKEMAGGYRLIDTNYTILVEALKNRYGDEEKIAEELQQEFIGLPRATMSPQSLLQYGSIFFFYGD